MAAVVMAPTTDLVALGKHAANVLPSYAVPIFLRALPQYVNRPGPCSRSWTRRTDEAPTLSRRAWPQDRDHRHLQAPK